MTEVRTVEEAATELGVHPKWLRAQIRERGVPHLNLSRGRMALTADQHAALLDALTAGGVTPTKRSQSRQRKGKGRAA